MVAAGVTFVGVAVLGESLAAGSVALSLAAAARVALASSGLRRRLDLALLAGAGATLIPLCRELPAPWGAVLSLAAAAPAFVLLQFAREAQPEISARRALSALQFAVAAAGAGAFLFEPAPAIALLPAGAAIVGALRCPEHLWPDPSRFVRAGPSLFAAVACVTALLAAGTQSDLAGAACAALLLIHGVEHESRRARESLEASRKRARLRSLLENIDEAICASDLNGEMTFVNRRFLGLFGLQATFCGRFSDLLSEADAESFDRQLRTCIESDKPVSGMRYKARRSDGSRIPVECSVALVKSGGLSIGLQASLRDVSQEELIEESQRALAQRLESFVETMPLGCIVWDADFRVQEWNPAAERIFGWPALEVLGLRYDEILATEPADPVLSDWPELRQGRQVGARACRNRSRAGAQVDCEWFHTALRDAAGEVVAVASMVQDVTERRRLEEQLRAAQKLEAVGTLAGGVAHDFNNLLTIILGNVALSRMSLGPDHPAVAALGNAQTASERAADLVRQLLSFSRREPGDRQIVRLQERLAETARLFQYDLGESVAFDVEIAEDLAPVQADLGQVGRLVMNLLVNARDAADSGGRLRLRAENVVLNREQCLLKSWARPGEFVTLSVSDDGCGMDERTRDRLFEPFFTTKEVGKGTGLGLAVVYGIVQSHGGGIEVKSQPGEGAEFTVYLPACRRAEGRAGAPHVPAKVMARVLLIERDEALRAACRARLSEDGFAVSEAADDLQALEQLRTEGDSFDLAVIDMDLPSRAGWLVWVEARRLRPRMPAILTGSERWVADGLPGETVLPKPFAAEQLAEAIVQRLHLPQLTTG